MSSSLLPYRLYPPGSPVSGIFQARIMEWVAMPPSRIFLTQESNSHFLSPVLAGRFFTTNATLKPIYMFSSAQFSYSVMSNALWPHGLQHGKLPCPSPTPGVYSDSCPLSQWCHPIISSSVISFSSHLQSFPTSASFPMSRLFISGGQNIGVSASAWVLLINIQDWFPLGWTGWISLQSKGLSRVFSNTTVQKHQFFGAKLSLCSNTHIYTWPLEKP